MAIINLRDYYPFYASDCFMEVSDEVAEMFKEFDRREAAYRLRTYRHKAYYSLDRDDGLEHEAVFVALSPHELYAIPLIGMMGWNMRLSLSHFRPMSCTSGKLPCRSFTLLLPACRTNRQNGFTPILFLA